MSRSWLIVPLLILYLLDLGGVGFISTDEPRYASIGREMARSGDWVTPRLDGAPWFEKPPLLYWMIGAGHLARLPDEWAARLPVALLSIAFLLLFFYIAAREFSTKTSIAAVTILATSAGWLAYSFGALTDLPMSALLGAAMLVALFENKKWSGFAAGALLGLAVLAKAFVPLVLFAPAFVISRGKRVAIAVGLIAVALPWHVLCLLRNGQVFWAEYFWRQQFSRFFTTERQHVQHWWFYLPVLLAGLFPWTPLVALVARRSTYSDVRIRYLGAWLLYGIAFFSASQNKLAGYLLPLMPGMALLLAVGLDQANEKSKIASWLLGASTASLIVLPTVVGALPDAFLTGVGRTHINLALGMPFLLVAGVVWWLSWSGKPSLAILAGGMAVVFGVAYFKGAVFPELDDRVSVRGFWRAHGPEARLACLEGVGRSWEYGLNYYAGHPFHACSGGETPKIVVIDGRLAVVR
ncbi:MAG TPA: glycosyltransferase family 39 protein [Bryobacteraceae bacterium]|nr:glycosyltransferase family 39 protein [Bryobacteraceae bacterium]